MSKLPTTIIVLIISATLSCTRPITTFKLMEFNIEDGGTLISMDKVIEAIRKGGPDVVAIEEANGNTPRLAAKLGWPYYNNRQHIISRYPLIDPGESQGHYIFVEVAPNKVVAVSNVHLPAHPYGPEELDRGVSAQEVLKLERELRLSALQIHLEGLPILAKMGIPVFLTGDFNTPSHLDWQQQTSHHFPWPVSKSLAEGGFHDAYREIYPDPVQHPGPTWWASRPKVPGWNPTNKDQQARIDFIYAIGPARTLKSQIIGEINKPGVAYSVTPWPSDHRAIISTFAITPASPPLFVAINKRKITVGDVLKVRFHASGKKGEKIVVSKIDTSPKSCEEKVDGWVSFSTTNWQSGIYELSLQNAQNQILSRALFYVKPPDSSIQLTLNKTHYYPGEPIIAYWKHAPGNRFDWLVLKRQDAELEESRILESAKTGATVEGAHVFQKSVNVQQYLSTGRYELLYMLDDSYDIAARTSLTILPPER
jgi:endonuclease/exonuclease/phosphatase family metal-dependent hydrolase